MKKLVRLTESDLHRIVKKSVKRELKEGFEDYDVFMHNYNDAMSDYYADDPRDYYPDGKEGDIEYSWDEFAYENGNTPKATKYRQGLMNDMQFNRNLKKYWTKRDNERGKELMKKWVNGKRSLDDLDDAEFDIDASIRGLNRK